MSFQDFSLIPADDPVSSPQEDLDAAVAGALAVADGVLPAATTVPTPLGCTWRFDWTAGQFVRVGHSPQPTSGLGAVAEWCNMAVRVARFAHPVFSDDFGMEDPDGPVGELAVGEVLADYERHLVDALAAHDRVSSVENVSVVWDPVSGVVTLERADVITDEDQTLTVSDVTLREGGSQ